MMVNKYSNTYHNTIKIKSVEVQSSNNIDSSQKIMKKMLNLKLVMLLEYRYIFANVYTPSWSEEVFVIDKVKNAVPCTYVISDLNGKKIVGELFTKKRMAKNE